MRFTNPPYFPEQRSSPTTPVLAILAAAIPAGITAFAFRSRQAAVLPPVAMAAPNGTITPGSGIDAARGHLNAAVQSLTATGIGENEARFIVQGFVQGWIAPFKP